MAFLSRCLRGTFMALFIAALATLYGLYFVYEVKVEGELVLNNAPEDVQVIREADTQILHIKAKSWKGISYGQGFASAQNRLWQMEKTRRLGKGKLSEIFGKEALPIDEFMRSVGLERSSKETIKIATDPIFTESIQAYADGVNDYVQGVSMFGDDQKTARLLPPEFLTFGITKDSFEPWTPVDCALTIRVIQFHLTWNWASDLQREAMRQKHPDLEALIEEIMPFTGDLLHDHVTIVEDDDLKQFNMFSEESLVEKYRKATDHVRSASPPKEEGKTKVSPHLKEYLDMKESLLGADRSLLGEQAASNNFVVHGDHTETGMPLFASDPHLANMIPSAWLLYSLEFTDGSGHRISGGQLPGVPAIGIGRSNTITWGCTTSRVDSADVWQEKLNEDETKYMLDGEWRDLKVVEETIKVKGQADQVYKVKMTHRGPIMPYKLMQLNSGLLFGGEAPDMEHNHWYSFAWSGQWAGDDSFHVLQNIYNSKDLHELYAKFDGEMGESYQGLGQNVLFADTSGNIGYRLLMTIPERKDKTPFIGSRVLDGTTTKWDWTGKIIHQKDLPRSLNPKKGYAVSANGMQTSDQAINDYGATSNSPGRTLRIDEILKTATESGKKLTLADLGAIQQDVTDVIARRMTPKIIEIADRVVHHLTDAEKEDVQQMTKILKDWEGTFEETSVAASVYIRWYIQFVRSLFSKQVSDESQRMAFSDNYHFTDAYQNIITEIHSDQEKSHFQVICEDAYPKYSGRDFCAYSIAMALVETKAWLTEHVSSNQSKWIWRNNHVNDYANMPWSKTPLKFLFHQSVPVPGNDNTPNVSKVSARKNKDNAVISSVASANYKMLIQLAKDPKDDQSFFSIDTGMHAHMWQGNWFDMNKRHLEGSLYPMRWRQGDLDKTATTTLVLKPSKKVQSSTSGGNDEL